MEILFAVLVATTWTFGDLAAAVPPPPEQSAADCSTPTYASDQLVCADPALLALDRRMVQLLGAAGTATRGVTLHWFEPQQVWFRRRSLCAFSPRHASCLRAAYGERIGLLSALAGQASGPGHPALLATCPGAPWGNGPVRLPRGVHAPPLIEDGSGAVLAVASALQPQDDWSPFLRIARENDGIRLEPSQGRVVRCRVLVDRQPGQAAPQGDRTE